MQTGMRALSRTEITAGKSITERTAITPTTTSSSTSVKKCVFLYCMDYNTASIPSADSPNTLLWESLKQPADASLS